MPSQITTSQFQLDSQKLVEAFLQTVVMIDDRAYEPTTALSKPTAPPPSPVRPSFNVPRVPREQVADKTIDTGRQTASGEVDLDEESPIEQAENAEETSEDVAHELDAKRLVEQFSNKGIICAVLRPSPVEIEQFEKKVYALSETADVLILDWVWFKDVEGKKVSEIIEKVTKETSQHDRLRLILIYTGEKHLKQIIDNLSQALELAGVTKISRVDDFTIQSGGTRVTVYGKGNVEPSNDVLRARVSPFDHLPNTVVAEFAKMTAGLISNVALTSLSEIRRAAYRLLARFNPRLDAPFLAHRALLNPPSEANDQLIPLIVSEIEAILEDQVSGDLLSNDAIMEWLDTMPNPLALVDSAPKIKTEAAARTMIKELSTEGVGGHDRFTVPNEPSWAKKLSTDERKAVPAINKLTNLIAGETVHGRNEALELLMSLRPRYGDKPPILTLGTLLKFERQRRPRRRYRGRHGRQRMLGEIGEPQGTTYWLCLQPVCDAYIRTGGLRRRFPLLELKLTEERFNLIATDGEKVIRLRGDPKPYKIRMVEFETNSESKVVVATVRQDSFWFQPTIWSSSFKWLGQLKSAQAQRLAQELSTEVGRVGLTESEWLRRNAK